MVKRWTTGWPAGWLRHPDWSTDSCVSVRISFQILRSTPIARFLLPTVALASSARMKPTSTHRLAGWRRCGLPAISEAKFLGEYPLLSHSSFRMIFSAQNPGARLILLLESFQIPRNMRLRLRLFRKYRGTFPEVLRP